MNDFEALKRILTNAQQNGYLTKQHLEIKENVNLPRANSVIILDTEKSIIRFEFNKLGEITDVRISYLYEP